MPSDVHDEQCRVVHGFKDKDVVVIFNNACYYFLIVSYSFFWITLAYVIRFGKFHEVY